MLSWFRWFREPSVTLEERLNAGVEAGRSPICFRDRRYPDSESAIGELADRYKYLDISSWLEYDMRCVGFLPKKPEPHWEFRRLVELLCRTDKEGFWALSSITTRHCEAVNQFNIKYPRHNAWIQYPPYAGGGVFFIRVRRGD